MTITTTPQPATGLDTVDKRRKTLNGREKQVAQGLKDVWDDMAMSLL